MASRRPNVAAWIGDEWVDAGWSDEGDEQSDWTADEIAAYRQSTNTQMRGELAVRMRPMRGLSFDRRHKRGLT